MKLTRAVYADLIIQDIAQLMRHMPDTLERQHIEDVLNNSIECYYGDNSRNAGLEAAAQVADMEPSGVMSNIVTAQNIAERIRALKEQT